MNQENMPLISEHKTIRYQNNELSECNEAVVNEKMIHVFVNGKQLLNLIALPEHIKYLIAGFLLTECIIHKAQDIKSFVFNKSSMSSEVLLAENLPAVLSEKVKSVTTGCGKGITFVSPLQTGFFKPLTDENKFKAEEIINVMRKLQRHSDLFSQTGGVHSAALVSDGEIKFFADDIGRHNAVDKVAGWKLFNQTTLDSECNMLVSTGRMSSEIITKVCRARIPLIVSPSAPTSGSLQLAESLGITMIGFARSSRFNIYSHAHRIQA